MKSIVPATFLMVAACTGFHSAQAQSTNGILTGAVADSLTKQVLPYATIVLKKASDPQFVLSTMSDEKGSFRFEGLQAGSYSLLGTFIGYRSFVQEAITVEAGAAPQLNVLLAPDRKLLKAVTVTAVKPFIEMRADKVVLNVAESPIATGGTAAEVLGRAPGVVESNGSYSVRGKQVAVLIDGKYTNMSGSDLKDMLAAMPSNTLDKVEVITNPSAKYDAHGGALINIVTTKSKSFGTNGTLTSGLGTGRYARYSSGLSLNHRQEKFNLYGSYDYLRLKNYSRSETQRAVSPEAALAENGNEVAERHSNTAKLGLDYDINKTSSAGILVKGIMSFRNRAGGTGSVLAGTGTNDLLSNVRTTGDSRFISPTVNLYYKSTAGKPGTELRLSADYFRYQKAWHDDISTFYQNADGTDYADPWYLRNNSPASNDVKSLAVDYTRPLEKATLEMGAKSTFTTTDNDIRWQELTDGAWQTDAGKTNHFIYRENINAAYITYNKKIQKVGLQAGLRTEQTNTEGTSLTTGQTTRRNYLNFFPSVTVNYDQSDKQQLSFSYQRRIDRFRFDLVNPFVTYVSQYLYYQGNPNVRPSTSHNFSFSHTYNNQLSTSISYSHHQDVLTQVFRKRDATAVVSTFENSNSAESIDINVAHSKQLLHNKWSSTNTGGLSYAKVNSTTDASLNSATPSLYASSNNSFQVAKGLKLELSAYYYSPMKFGAYDFAARYAGSLGMSKSVLQGAGTLTLNVTDLLNTQTSRYTISSFGVNSTNESKAESRFVRLNFSYRFGNKNVKASKARKIGTESEQRRMEAN
ncbi:TonB-dependent receptor [Hymenobacter lucidus]|uniref:TonB-dependent receptor n=1 Tax=Hymenobacter lucidus TaxID=2880930 RepID=A0ABS8AUD8_9BACT|nr:TonB-dependent receptor [Hymenobacter lucidus]MCB2409837.1 TonB-dependent receptor [Hymenobacter lucidus]